MDCETSRNLREDLFEALVILVTPGGGPVPVSGPGGRVLRQAPLERAPHRAAQEEGGRRWELGGVITVIRQLITPVNYQVTLSDSSLMVT